MDLGENNKNRKCTDVLFLLIHRVRGRRGSQSPLGFTNGNPEVLVYGTTTRVTSAPRNITRYFPNPYEIIYSLSPPSAQYSFKDVSSLHQGVPDQRPATALPLA